MAEKFFTTSCRGCGAPIEFRVTRDGKKVPVELEKIRIYQPPAGKIGEVVGLNERGEYKRGTRMPQPGRGFEEVQESHFAHCPEADRFRTEPARRYPEPGRAVRHPRETVRLPAGKTRHTPEDKREPAFEQISLYSQGRYPT